MGQVLRESTKIVNYSIALYFIDETFFHIWILAVFQIYESKFRNSFSDGSRLYLHIASVCNSACQRTLLIRLVDQEHTEIHLRVNE